MEKGIKQGTEKTENSEENEKSLNIYQAKKNISEERAAAENRSEYNTCRLSNEKVMYVVCYAHR